MTPWLTSIASLALCYAGLSGICLAMSRHYRQVWQRDASQLRARALLIGGWLLLASSLVGCVFASGPSVGIVLWFGLISLSSALIALLLPYAPYVFAAAAIIAAPTGIALLALKL